MSAGNFSQAVADYLYLLDRDYPAGETVKLVGDRYRLAGSERVMLYRGVMPSLQAEKSKLKLTSVVTGNLLIIDGYNVFFTVMNYLLGKKLFLANDGVLRDVGEVYGRVEKEDFFYRAVEIVLKYIVGEKLAGVEIYLDSPVTNSVVHCERVVGMFRENRLVGEVFLVKRVDGELKKRATGIMATSDSEIMEGVGCMVVDLPRLVLQSTFGRQFKFLELGL